MGAESRDNPLDHVMDQPWVLDGRPVSWMSAQVAAMILVGVVLLVALPLMVRRRGLVPRGAFHIVELFVVLVRDRIAVPALGPNADQYVPFLATLLAFLLGCNLIGLLPLPAVYALMGNHTTPIGGTATGSLYVCGALAAMTLVVLLLSGYWKGVKALWQGPQGHGRSAARHAPAAEGNLIVAACSAAFRRRWPLPVAVVLGVPLWLNAFVPAMPGAIGMILWPFLLALEVLSSLTRCVALCIRLFVNMTAGHLLLFVVMGMAAAGRGWATAYVSLPAGLASVVILGMEMFVSLIQAYVFTFLTAIFIGMAVNPQH